MPCHRIRHLGGEGAIVRDQDRLGVFVMLGLREQVRGDPIRLIGAIGDHQDLGGARDHVDADGAEDQALGGGDIGVAGAHDLVHRRNRLGAVGERGDGLRPAHPIDLCDACDLGGGHHRRVERAIRRRHDHGDALHAGDARGDRVHQHGARIGGRAAGHVEPDRVQRAPAGTQPDTDVVAVVEISRHEPAVEGLDPFRRLHECVAYRIGRCGGVGGDVCRRNPNLLRRERDAVEARRVVEQRRIAAFAHRIDDRRSLSVDVRRHAPPGLEQGVEGGVEAGARTIQPSSPHFSPWSWSARRCPADRAGKPRSAMRVHRASGLTHSVGRTATPFGSRPGARPRRRGPLP